MQIHEDTDTTADSPHDREEAFQTPQRDWRNKPLHAFSISRRAYFLTWRGTLNLPSLSQLLSSDTEAFLADALRLLFLCLTHDEELEDLRAGGFHEMQRACDAWANESVTIEDLPQIILNGLKIWNGASINRHAAAPDPDHSTEAPGKPLPSPSKKPSTSPPSRGRRGGAKPSSAGNSP